MTDVSADDVALEEDKSTSSADIVTLDDSFEQQSVVMEETAPAAPAAPVAATKSKSSISIDDKEKKNDAPPRGNALYGRLAALMMSKDPGALDELKMLGKQIEACKATPETELWDEGDDLDTGGVPRLGTKRAGVSLAPGGRMISMPLDKKNNKPQALRPQAPIKASASNSDDSNDASNSSVDVRARASTSSFATTGGNRSCIRCHESSSSLSNPILTCEQCSLSLHAKCARPNVDDKDFTPPRYMYTCFTCRVAKRPRSESPKPRSTIAISALPEKKKRKESDSSTLGKAPPNLAATFEAFKKKKEMQQQQNKMMKK